MVTVFERCCSLITVKVILVTCMVMPELRGITSVCMPLETLSALNYHNSFILTVGIIGVGSHARDMYGNSHSQGTGTCLLLEIPSMHKLVQYVQSLCECGNEGIYELKRVLIANFEVDLCPSSVEYCSISNVNSLYQCSCKQCCTIALYAMCYSVINPCGYWSSRTLSALASNGNTLYSVMGGKRHMMSVDLPESESVSGDKPYCLRCKQWYPMLQFG